MKKAMMIFFILAVGLWLSNLSFAKIYHWIDEQGVTHFSDFSPENFNNTKQIQEIDLYDNESEIKNEYDINIINNDKKIVAASCLSEHFYGWIDNINNKKLQDIANQLNKEIIFKIQADSFRKVSLESISSLERLSDRINNVIYNMDVKSVYVGNPNGIETVYIIFYGEEGYILGKDKGLKRRDAAIIFWHYIGTKDISDQYLKKYLDFTKNLMQWFNVKKKDIMKK